MSSPTLGGCYTRPVKVTISRNKNGILKAFAEQIKGKDIKVLGSDLLRGERIYHTDHAKWHIENVVLPGVPITFDVQEGGNQREGNWTPPPPTPPPESVVTETDDGQMALAFETKVDE